MGASSAADVPSPFQGRTIPPNPVLFFLLPSLTWFTCSLSHSQPQATQGQAGLRCIHQVVRFGSIPFRYPMHLTNAPISMNLGLSILVSVRLGARCGHRRGQNVAIVALETEGGHLCLSASMLVRPCHRPVVDESPVNGVVLGTIRRTLHCLQLLGVPRRWGCRMRRYVRQTSSSTQR